MSTYFIALIIIGLVLFLLIGRLVFFNSWAEFGGGMAEMIPEFLTSWFWWGDAVDGAVHSEGSWSGLKVLGAGVLAAGLVFGIHISAEDQVRSFLAGMGL